jgi:hypothetical protein
MSGLAFAYCVALFGATFSACAALILIKTMDHLDGTHG